MASEWYYTNGDSKKGPISSRELKSLASSGEVRDETLVWKEGLAAWTQASKLKGLIEESGDVTFDEWSSESESNPAAPDLPEEIASEPKPIRENVLPVPDYVPTQKLGKVAAITSSVLTAAKTAGRMAAKETERLRLENVVLPKLYWKLGSAALAVATQTGRASDTRINLDRLQSELATIKSAVPIKSTTVGDKAKAAALAVANKAKCTKLEMQINLLIRRLGQEFFESNQILEGTSDLLNEIRNSITRLSILKDDSFLQKGAVFTKRRVGIAAVVVVLLLSSLFLTWPSKTRPVPKNSEIARNETVKEVIPSGLVEPAPPHPAPEQNQAKLEGVPQPMLSDQPPQGWNPISSTVFGEIIRRRPNLSDAAVIMWRKWDETDKTPNGFVHYKWKDGNEFMTVIYEPSGAFRQVTVSHSPLKPLPDEMKQLWLKHIDALSNKQVAKLDGKSIQMPRREVKITANGEVEVRPEDVKKENEKLQREHEQWLKIIKTKNPNPLTKVKGRELEVRINTTTAEANQWWIPPRNQSLTSTRCIAQEGELIIGFHVDVTKWQQMSRTRFPLLVRLFDKNGEYLTHFETQERFTCSQDAVDDFETIRNRFVADGLQSEAKKFTAILLKPIGNELHYTVNLRDLRDASIVEIGFTDCEQFPQPGP